MSETGSEWGPCPSGRRKKEGYYFESFRGLSFVSRNGPSKKQSNKYWLKGYHCHARSALRWGKNSWRCPQRTRRGHSTAMKITLCSQTPWITSSYTGSTGAWYILRWIKAGNESQKLLIRKDTLSRGKTSHTLGFFNGCSIKGISYVTWDFNLDSWNIPFSPIYLRLLAAITLPYF